MDVLPGTNCGKAKCATALALPVRGHPRSRSVIHGGYQPVFRGIPYRISEKLDALRIHRVVQFGTKFEEAPLQIPLLFFTPLKFLVRCIKTFSGSGHASNSLALARSNADVQCPIATVKLRRSIHRDYTSYCLPLDGAIDRGLRRNSMNPVSAMPKHIPHTINWNTSTLSKLRNLCLCVRSKNPTTARKNGTKTPVATCR
jgi:hypothetical protein